MSGYSLSRERFALLYAVMLVAAAGNTAMQSLLPSIGRELGVPDVLVAVAFSLSAVLWVIAAPYWAKRADMRGRRALMRLGLYGFISSMLTCGLVVAAGLAGLLPPLIVFIIFSLGRGIYGAWGSASPPAVQAYVAARTEGEQRTNALSAIASSFGLGTIIGPAIAPLFIFQPLGLSGPLIVFAAIGAVVLARRRRGAGLEDPDDLGRVSVVEAFRPEGTGTMKEGVSGIPDVGGEPAGSHPKGTVRPEVAAGAGEGRRRGEGREHEGGW